MSYEKQNFTKGQILTSAHLNHIEDGIAKKSSVTKCVVTLSNDAWDGTTQVLAIDGVTADNIVIVSPTPDNYEAYHSNAVRASIQEDGKLTFVCSSAPNVTLSVNVVIIDEGE